MFLIRRMVESHGKVSHGPSPFHDDQDEKKWKFGAQAMWALWSVHIHNGTIQRASEDTRVIKYI